GRCPTCGDGRVEGDEECDDGNTGSADGCDYPTCTFSCHDAKDCRQASCVHASCDPVPGADGATVGKRCTTPEALPTRPHDPQAPCEPCALDEQCSDNDPCTCDHCMVSLNNPEDGCDHSEIESMGLRRATCALGPYTPRPCGQAAETKFTTYLDKLKATLC